MASNDDVMLCGTWANLYVWRIRWALDLKGVDYMYIEEDPYNDSGNLLLFKVPKLLHKGTSILESQDFLDYIDKTWAGIPILSWDPEEQRGTRYWVDNHDKKLQDAIQKAFFYQQRQEEKDDATVTVQEILEKLDRELDGRRFFGGKGIAYADLVFGWLAVVLRAWEEVVGFKVMDAMKFPSLNYWMDNFRRAPEIRDILPPVHKLITLFHKIRHDMIMLGLQ